MILKTDGWRFRSKKVKKQQVKNELLLKNSLERKKKSGIEICSWTWKKWQSLSKYWPDKLKKREWERKCVLEREKERECVRVCLRERERERERVCACVFERQKERERDNDWIADCHWHWSTVYFISSPEKKSNWPTITFLHQSKSKSKLVLVVEFNLETPAETIRCQ